MCNTYLILLPLGFSVISASNGLDINLIQDTEWKEASKGCNFTNLQNSKPKSLINLSLSGKFLDSTKLWLDTINITMEPSLSLQEICCYIKFLEEKETFIETLKESSYKVIDSYDFSTVTIFVLAKGDEYYHQKLSYISPRKTHCLEGNVDDCNWFRFAYTDSTSSMGHDIIYLEEERDNPETEYEYYLYRTKEFHYSDKYQVTKTRSKHQHSIEVPSAEFSFYIVERGIYYDYTYIVLIAALLPILTLVTAVAVTIYKSKPTIKSVGFIYCQCEQHESYRKVMNSLEEFMQEFCKMDVKLVVLAPQSGDTNLGEKENFIARMVLAGDGMKIDDLDYIVHVPFPQVPHHQAGYELEIQDVKLKCHRIRHKVEIYMPWYIRQTKEGVLWASAECKQFELMQQFYQLVRFIHPCYYPSFFESQFRKDICKSKIENLLRSKGLLNLCILDVTNPLMQAPKKDLLNITDEKVINIDELLSTSVI